MGIVVWYISGWEEADQIDDISERYNMKAGRDGSVVKGADR